MRYIKLPTTNGEFQIVQDTLEQKVVCGCQDEKDAKIVLRSYNSAERSKEYRQRKKNI